MPDPQQPGYMPDDVVAQELAKSEMPTPEVTAQPDAVMSEQPVEMAEQAEVVKKPDLLAIARNNFEQSLAKVSIDTGMPSDTLKNFYSYEMDLMAPLPENWSEMKEAERDQVIADRVENYRASLYPQRKSKVSGEVLFPNVQKQIDNALGITGIYETSDAIKSIIEFQSSPDNEVVIFDADSHGAKINRNSPRRSKIMFNLLGMGAPETVVHERGANGVALYETETYQSQADGIQLVGDLRVYMAGDKFKEKWSFRKTN